MMKHRCGHCDRPFATVQGLRQHQQDKHGARRRLPSWERPRQRGTVPCHFCEATFFSAVDAMQHIRDCHIDAAKAALREAAWQIVIESTADHRGSEFYRMFKRATSERQMEKPATSFLVIDSETNKLPNYKLPADHPTQARLANLAMLFVTPDLVLEREVNLFVKPDGWDIEPEAAEVNGLTVEALERDGLPIAEVLAQYTAAIKEGRAVVAHNAQHDCKVLRGELRRAGLPDLFEQTPNVCTMRKSMGIVKKQDGKKGWPKLSDCVAHFGIDAEAPHKALADAHACLRVMRCLRELGTVDLTPTVHYASEEKRAEIAKNSATPQGEVLQQRLKASAGNDADAEIPE